MGRVVNNRRQLIYILQNYNDARLWDWIGLTEWTHVVFYLS